MMAPTREEVENDILGRTQVEIEPEETPLVEKIAKRKNSVTPSYIRSMYSRVAPYQRFAG